MLLRVCQRMGSQAGSQPLATKTVRNEGPIDVQRVLAQVHIGQICPHTVQCNIELLAVLIMLDGRIHIHCLSPRQKASSEELSTIDRDRAECFPARLKK